MVEELNHKDPSWLNALLLVAIFLTLSLVLVLAYKGWKEDHALHPSDHEGSSKIIADNTINLSGIPRVNVHIFKAWAYNELMPLIPWIKVGLTPFLQWIVIPPAIILLVRHHLLLREKLEERSDRQC